LNSSRKYVYNAGWYIFGSSIQGLVPFISTPFLTRILIEEDFSKFVLLVAIATILSFLFSLGLPAAITRELILNKDAQSKNFETVQALKKYLLAPSIFFLFVSLLFTDLIQLVILAISLALALAIFQIDMAVLRAQHNAKGFVLLAVLSTAIPLFFMTLLLFLGFLENTFIVFYTFFVLFIAVLINARSLSKKFILKDLGPLVKLGYPTIPHGLGMSLMQYGDRVVIGAALGLAAAGKIQIAALIGTAPLLLLSTINNAWVASVLEKFSQSESIGEIFLNKTTKFLSFLISIIAVVTMIASDFILKIFAPTNYGTEELSQVVILMAISSSIYIFYLRNIYILAYKGNFTSLAWITPSSIILQVTVIFLMAPRYGLIAAALGLLLSTSSQAILTQIFAKRLAPEIKLTSAPLLALMLSSFSAIWILF
jgi:O-antigen/teichoic acid export membrane protein